MNLFMALMDSLAVHKKQSIEGWLVLCLLCASAGMFLWQCLAIGDARVDDAYFTFSYAKNLALGNGPVYSHGLRVEGYSTFLWMLCMAIPLLFTQGEALIPAARVMGAPFILLLGFAMYRLFRALGASRLVAAAGVFLLSFNSDMAAAYLTGMETVPYTAVLLFAFTALVESFSKPRWRIAAAWAALAVGLMRIDGFIPFGFLMVCALLREFMQGTPKPIRTFFRLSFPPIVVYCLWFLWRWHYYGLPLPSTYYAKALIPKIMPQRGFEYVSSEIISGWLWGGLLAWLWLAWRRYFPAVLLGSYAVLHLIYVVRVGGDWMPFGRFVLPVVPILLLLFVFGSMDFVRWAFTKKLRLRLVLPVLPIFLLVMLVIRMDHRFFNNRLEEEKYWGVKEQQENVDRYIKEATFLRQIVPAGGRLVTDYGGVFSCYTDGALIEMWGLANAEIATRGDTERINPIYGKTCAACYPELNPEFFHVMIPLVRPEPAFSSAEEVIQNVWQTDTIGRYIDFTSKFSAGRVVNPSTKEALYFLQKRDAGLSTEDRTTTAGYRIEFPFEARL